MAFFLLRFTCGRPLLTTVSKLAIVLQVLRPQQTPFDKNVFSRTIVVRNILYDRQAPRRRRSDHNDYFWIRWTEVS